MKQESFIRSKLIMQYKSSYATINAGQMKRGLEATKMWF